MTLTKGDFLSLTKIPDIATIKSPIDGLREFIKEYLGYWVNRPRELSFFFLSMSKERGNVEWSVRHIFV